MPELPENVTGLAQVPPVPPEGSNVAVTERAWFIVSTQPLVPVHAPFQPMNVEPLAGAAVSVTDAFAPKLATHAVPQLMPEGDEVMVPLPVPALDTLSEKVAMALKVAVTARTCVIDTEHVVAVPVQAPLQPANVELLATAAVSVTTVSLA